MCLCHLLSTAEKFIVICLAEFRVTPKLTSIFPLAKNQLTLFFYGRTVILETNNALTDLELLEGEQLAHA